MQYAASDSIDFMANYMTHKINIMKDNDQVEIINQGEERVNYCYYDFQN